jgi:cysteine desulfurase
MPIHPAAREAMLRALDDLPGNAHSMHGWGLRARDAVEAVRETAAEAIGAESPDQITFTSGSTEAAAWLVRMVPELAISPFEHSAVRAVALAVGAKVLSSSGWETERPSTPGPMAHLAVHNETGTVWHPELMTDRDVLIDATQALGKTDFQVESAAAAFFSAHKLGGPLGIGMVYLRDGYLPALFEGEQEGGRRAGTLNVPGIVGFGAVLGHLPEIYEEWRAASMLGEEALIEALTPTGAIRIGGSEKIPHITAWMFEGVEGAAMVQALDERGFAASAGAACSSRTVEPSPSLLAAGFSEEHARSVIRASFLPWHSPDDAVALGRAMCESAESFRTR